jgi:hypothetical protein
LNPPALTSSAEWGLANGAVRGGFHRLNEAIAADVTYKEKNYMTLHSIGGGDEIGLHRRRGIQNSLAEAVVAGDGHR